ncbi:MAG: hypothetical protein MUE50_12195 [Pirellulaceae bacterium]|nr:hypothetical protein [Pirellulaceae bacterium]
MSQPTNYQYVKLGMNLEYLRGISTASVAVTTNLDAYPDLAANLPAHRLEATRVIAVLKSLLIQLEEMDLQHSLAAATEFRPMMAQMETYISQNRGPAPIVLQDGFANKLAGVAKQVSLVLKEELGSQVG